VSFNPKQPRVPAGSAGGGRWGAARDSKASSAQKDTRGTKVAGDFADLDPSRRRDYVKALSDDDLKKLTGVVYSSRTSDPSVVAMRLVVASEMGKRGLDVKDYGALGGGLSKKAPTKAQLKSRVAKRRTPARPRAKK
jgi:hypothetical protein